MVGDASDKVLERPQLVERAEAFELLLAACADDVDLELVRDR